MTLEELVVANRILYARGIVDGFGHVSVRDPHDSERFFLARNIAPALVEVDDIMTFALDGTPLGDPRAPYLERFIHGSIYRARPDVAAVVHSHAPAIIPFGIVREAVFQPVYHMASFLRGPIPVFDIRDAAGADNDMLIRDQHQGDALARALSAHAMVLMRGHGSTTVGATLQEAVFRAVYAEGNARILADALRLGTVTALSATEATRSATSNAGQIARAWELWTREIASARPGEAGS